MGCAERCDRACRYADPTRRKSNSVNRMQQQSGMDSPAGVVVGYIDISRLHALGMVLKVGAENDRASQESVV